jgi:glucokinase
VGEAATDFVVAVDLGGSLTKVAYADPQGRLSAPVRLPTHLGDGGDGLVSWLAGQIRTTAASRSPYRCRGFGVVVPGIIDATGGRVVAATNLGWYDVPLRDRLTALTGLPGAVAHDVRSAGVAEWRLGAAQGVPNALFLALGTGIAGAMVVDGRMLDADGYAGELGHVRVAAAGDLPCACGQRGCLETVASAAGVVRTHARSTETAVDRVTAVYEPAVGEPLSGAQRVAELARRGDEPALAAFAVATDALTEVLLSYLTVLAPELVVIGGGLAGSADLFLPQVTNGLRDRVTFQRLPRIAPALLGADAGVLGAGLVGWDFARAQGGAA